MTTKVKVAVKGDLLPAQHKTKVFKNVVEEGCAKYIVINITKQGLTKSLYLEPQNKRPNLLI